MAKRAQALTIDDVEAALRALEETGLKPTVRLVHQKLGRGSMSTITAHLRAIAAARADADVGTLPDPILTSLRAAADALWLELADAADARIEAVTSAADARVTEALAERDTARDALTDLADEHGTLVATLAERDRSLAEREVALECLGDEARTLARRVELDERDRAALAERLADRDRELVRALEALKRAESARESSAAECERLAAARALDSERHAAERAALESTVERLRGELEALGAAAATRAEEVARLESRLEAQGARVDELTTRHATLQSERDTARDRAERIDAALGRARADALASERLADASRQAVLVLHAHIGRLEARLRASGVAAEEIEPIPVLPSAEQQSMLALPPDAKRRDRPGP